MAKTAKKPVATKLGEGTPDHITPPFKLGHSERQYLLKSEGLPSAGWVTNCYGDKGTLMAMGEHVPSILRDAIDKKAYRKVSAEIYDDPPDEIKKAIKDAGSKGKVLRAVAFLGEDLPRVKSLKDLPAMYKETGSFKKPIEIFKAGVKDDDGKAYTQEDIDDISRNFHILKDAGIDPSKFSDKNSFTLTRYFSEPTQGEDSMDAAALRKMLEEKGVSPEVLKMIPDDQLLMFVDACKEQAGGESEEGELTEEEKKKKAEEEAAAKKKADDEEAAKKNQEPVGKTMTYAEVQKLLDKHTEKTTQTLLKKFSELTGKSNEDVKKAADESIKAIAQAGKQHKLTVFSEKVSSLKSSGMPPALDNGGALAFIADELLNSKTVKKFGEKEVSAFDAFNALLDQIPAHLPKKGEKGAVGTGAKTDFEEHQKAEVDKVKATYSQYADVWDKQGLEQAALVKAFEISLKDNKKLTAAEFFKNQGILAE